MENVHRFDIVAYDDVLNRIATRYVDRNAENGFRFSPGNDILIIT